MSQTRNSPEDLNRTSFRKLAHLEVCLEESVESHQTTRLEDFHFVHRALSDLNYDELDTSVNLWNKRLEIPLIAAAMTGGHPDVRKINETIAISSQKFHFGMGVGSQRAAIEKQNFYVVESFGVVRKLAPESLLIANLGAAQFGDRWKFGTKEAQDAIDMIQADALAIHVNPAQELVQMEGDVFFKNFLSRVDKMATQISVPVILKEVGSGFCKEDAAVVEKSPLAGIDVGGLGGTSWVGVEAAIAKRKNERLEYETGNVFWDWGIPTALSVLETRSATNKIIIATGGVRNGMQAAKLIALGANVVGMALPFLKAARKGTEEVEFLVKKFEKELKMAMMLTGSRTLADLRKSPMVVTGFSKEWLSQRGINFPPL